MPFSLPVALQNTNKDNILVGQASYNSTISNHVEYLPVTVDLLMANGCDGTLLSLVKDMHAAGLLESVKVGQSGITGGEALVKRWEDGE
jgi:hypothetical protein